MPKITIYTEDNRLGTAEIPPFVVGDSTTWTLLFQNAAGDYYSPAAVTMKLGHINGLPDGSYPDAFKWVDRCANEHVASIAVSSGVPTVTWNTQPSGGMVGSSGIYIVRGQIPDGRITGITANDVTLERLPGQTGPITTQFTFSTDTGGRGAYGKAYWETKAYILRVTITDGGSGYTTAPTVVFGAVQDGGGNHATATATISDCGSVIAIKVTSNGCGYTSAPDVSFSGGSGSGAAAVCEWVLSDGTAGITSLKLLTGGTGFNEEPTVTIGGDGSGATATALGWDGIKSVKIDTLGTGYAYNPLIAFNATTVTMTIASPSVVSWATHGKVADDPVMFITTGSLPVGVTAGTTYYVSATGLTTNAFQFSATVGGASINTTAPTISVTIASPGVVTWTAHGKLAGDTVAFATTGALPTGISANTTYYVSATNLTGNTFRISATFGGAAINTSGTQSGTHTISQSGTHSGSLVNATAIITGAGQITAAVFTGVPTLTAYENVEELAYDFDFTNGGGSGARGRAHFTKRFTQSGFYAGVTKWSLTRVDILAPGTGYTSKPTYTLWGYVITGSSSFKVTVTNPGNGYSSPTVTIAGGGGTGMTASALTGVITGFAVKDPGQGYTTPTVTITGTGTGATATATASGRKRYGIQYIELTSTGAGYLAVPTCIGTIQAAYTPNTPTPSELGSISTYISSVQVGVEQSELPYKRAEVSSLVMGAVRLSGFSDGRYGATGQLQYDHSALIVRPRSIATASLTAGVDSSGNPIWLGTMNPINNYVTARLGVRRSTTLDLQVFGDGRMLFQGTLTILTKIS